MIGRRPRKPANDPSFVLNFDGFQAQEFKYFLVNFTLLLLLLLLLFFFFCNSQFRMSTISSMNVNVLASMSVVSWAWKPIFWESVFSLVDSMILNGF